MTNQEEYTVVVDRRDAGISDLLGSMLGLATAGTKFVFQQVGNAVSFVTEPQGVMNRVRNSMDKISDAMSQEAEESRFTGAASNPVSVDTLSGRKS
jgi:hypothetical protein